MCALFLTGSVVLVSTVDEKHLQLCETLPGLQLADKAFQIVQVYGRTEDKETNTAHTPLLSLFLSVRAYIKCVTSPLVCVAEVRPEFRQTVQVNALWSAIDELTPPAIMRQ